MTCPICEKPTLDAYRPFCSRRCADVDLGRWFNEGYTIPTNEDATADGDETDIGPALQKLH